MAIYRDETLVPGIYQYVAEERLTDPETGLSYADTFEQFLKENRGKVVVKQVMSLGHVEPDKMDILLPWTWFDDDKVEQTADWILFEVLQPVKWTAAGFPETASRASTGEPYKPDLPRTPGQLWEDADLTPEMPDVLPDMTLPIIATVGVGLGIFFLVKSR